MTIHLTEGQNAHVMLSLAEELEPRFGVKAEALAAAYESFCQHHDRARFEAEKRAIKSCNIIDFIRNAREMACG